MEKFFLVKDSYLLLCVTLMINMKQPQKINPKVLVTLRQLGYFNLEVKNGRVYARRGRDHLIIRLNKKGNLDFRLRAHQDLQSKTLPSHHYADHTEEKRIIKEFWQVFTTQLKKEKQSQNSA